MSSWSRSAPSGGLLRGLGAELRSPRQLALSLTAGLVIGAVVVIVAISFGALVYSGPLARFTAAGIGFALFGAVVVGIAVALGSSFPGMIATPQDSTSAIVALIAAAVAARLPTAATANEVLLTVSASVALITVATGLFFLVLGRFRLGALVRFIPYPVIGGFLAGTGWLLVRGSIGVMSDLPLTFGNLSLLVQPDHLLRWLPGVLFAVALLIMARRSDNFLVLPGMLLGSVALFYILLAATGTTAAEAGVRGFLLGPFPSDALWRPIDPAALPEVRWGLVLGQVVSAAPVLVVGVVALLLNASGLELALARDIDLDRELKAAGLANVVGGLGGGLPGFQTLSLSALAHRMSPNSRWVGLASGGVCLVALLAGGATLSFLPKQSLGGLLLFLGLAFLTEWVIDARSRLPQADYVIVLVILLVIATVGFLESVGLGIVIAVVLFVVNYSRIDVVRHELTGASHQSNVSRPREHREILRRAGEQQLILRLQGYLFFGTANSLVERIRKRAQDPSLPPLRYAVLDFHLVSGLDSSAVLSFVKLAQFAESEGVTLVLTELSDAARRQLEQGGLTHTAEDPVHIFSELDRGIEWCENEILRSEEAAEAEVRDIPIREFLSGIFPPDRVHDLLDHVEKRECSPGEFLMREGEAAEDLYYIESGQVTVQIDIPGGKPLRLLTMGAGSLVGEVEMYRHLPRTASVIVDRPTTVHSISAGSLAHLEQTDPAIAAIFHRFICRLLAERLANTNETLQALLG